MVRIWIEPMTDRNFEEAATLVNELFPPEYEEESEKLELSASLNPEKYQDFLIKNKISSPRYWVASYNGKIVGVIGLYCYEPDKEEAFWLGWFGVHPSSRGRGIGTRLLWFVINEAMKQGKKFLRLYTTTDPAEMASHKLYEYHGFKLVREEFLKGFEGLKKLYYELELRDA